MAECGHDFDVRAVAYDRKAFRARLEPECHRLGLSLPFVEHLQGDTKCGNPNPVAAQRPGSTIVLARSVFGLSS